jgi:hypothetical protein
MQVNPFTIPLADIGEMLQSLAPIIFVVLYGIAHLVGNLQQEKRKAAAPKPRPVQQPQDFGRLPAAKAAPGNPPAEKPPTLEESLRREVEEFLRRAQGQPPQQPKAQPQRPQQRPQQGRPAAAQRPNLPASRGRQPERPAERPDQPRRLVESQRPEPAAPLNPLTTESRSSFAPTPLGSGIALHTQTLTQHAQTLGADVAQADERMQEHLRQKFVHSVGALSPTTSVQRQATGSPAAQELRALLARPGGMRQVIIANEILRRPEERWDS